MISVGLERRLAVVATAALTLAIWVLPASATAARLAPGAGLASLALRSGSGVCIMRCYTVTDFLTIGFRGDMK
jgi:hypothetical protein